VVLALVLVEHDVAGDALAGRPSPDDEGVLNRGAAAGGESRRATEGRCQPLGRLVGGTSGSETGGAGTGGVFTGGAGTGGISAGGAGTGGVFTGGAGTGGISAGGPFGVGAGGTELGGPAAWEALPWVPAWL
jgi:hypothetical protein